MLTKQNALEILELASNNEVTVPIILSKLQIPISTAYHLISELEGAGLLGKVRFQIGPDGKRIDVWRAFVSAVNLRIGDSCSLELTPRTDTASKFLRLWQKVAGGQSGR